MAQAGNWSRRTVVWPSFRICLSIKLPLFRQIVTAEIDLMAFLIHSVHITLLSNTPNTEAAWINKQTLGR